MANDFNKVLVIGRLTREVEVRTFANGGKVANFGLATNNRKKNQQTGEWEDDPVFIDCEAFNWDTKKTADLCEKSLRKGTRVFLECRLKLDQWSDKVSGEKRSKLKFTVENLVFLDPKPQDGSRRPDEPPQTLQRALKDEYPPPHQDDYPTDSIPF